MAYKHLIKRCNAVEKEINEIISGLLSSGRVKGGLDMAAAALLNEKAAKIMRSARSLASHAGETMRMADRELAVAAGQSMAKGKSGSIKPACPPPEKTEGEPSHLRIVDMPVFPEPSAEGVSSPSAGGIPEPLADGIPSPSAGGIPQPLADGIPSPSAGGIPQPSAEGHPEILRDSSADRAAEDDLEQTVAPIPEILDEFTAFAAPIPEPAPEPARTDASSSASAPGEPVDGFIVSVSASASAPPSSSASLSASAPPSSSSSASSSAHPSLSSSASSSAPLSTPAGQTGSAGHARKGHPILSSIATATAYILVVLVAGLAVVSLGAKDGQPRTIFGYSVFTILTGSMERALPRDSMILVKETDPADIQVNDDITFLREDNSSVTHRVVTVFQNHENNGIAFQTKGVENPAPDREMVYAKNVVGKVLFHVPKLGMYIRFVHQNILITAVICVLLLALVEVLRRMVWARRDEAEEDEPPRTEMGRKPG